MMKVYKEGKKAQFLLCQLTTLITNVQRMMDSGDRVMDAIAAHDSATDCSDLEVCQNVIADADSGCPDDHVTVVIDVTNYATNCCNADFSSPFSPTNMLTVMESAMDAQQFSRFQYYCDNN